MKLESKLELAKNSKDAKQGYRDWLLHNFVKSDELIKPMVKFDVSEKAFYWERMSSINIGMDSKDITKKIYRFMAVSSDNSQKEKWSFFYITHEFGSKFPDCDWSKPWAIEWMDFFD